MLILNEAKKDKRDTMTLLSGTAVDISMDFCSQCKDQWDCVVAVGGSPLKPDVWGEKKPQTSPTPSS